MNLSSASFTLGLQILVFVDIEAVVVVVAASGPLLAGPLLASIDLVGRRFVDATVRRFVVDVFDARGRQQQLRREQSPAAV